MLINNLYKYSSFFRKDRGHATNSVVNTSKMQETEKKSKLGTLCAEIQSDKLYTSKSTTVRLYGSDEAEKTKTRGTGWT